MTSLFGLKKAIAAVPAVGALVILGAFSALANGSGAPVDSLQQCQDETGATCTNVQETSVIAVHRNNGPSVVDSGFATVITMNDLAPGNYVVTAKTVLFSNTASGFAFCELIVSPPGGASGVVDFWEWQTATATTRDYTANLQRPVINRHRIPFAVYLPEPERSAASLFRRVFGRISGQFCSM